MGDKDQKPKARRPHDLGESELKQERAESLKIEFDESIAVIKAAMRKLASRRGER